MIHNFSSEWHQMKDAVENARDAAISSCDELEEMICTEMLEALELSRCLFLMKYTHQATSNVHDGNGPSLT